MKRASVITLIIAAVLVIAGIITCSVARDMAEKSGNLLFSEARGSDSVKTVDLGDKNVNRIMLDFTDADVNVYGSSKDSFIEFVNFRETLYSLSVTNTSVSFSEIPDLSSMLRFWENGFSFKGMRYILNPRTYDDSRMKSINIYLADGYDLKQFSISADKTTVNLENLACNADYIITGENITLRSSSVRTNSTLRINGASAEAPASSANLTFDRSSFGAVNIKAESLELTGKTGGVVSASVECADGKIEWELPHYEASAPIPLKMNVETSGSLLINGKTEASPFVYDSTEDKDSLGISLAISAGQADVSLSSISFDAPKSEEKAE